MVENSYIVDIEKRFIDIFTLWEFYTSDKKGKLKKDITCYCGIDGGFRSDYFGGNPEPTWRGSTGIGYSIQDDLLVIGIEQCREETSRYKMIRKNKLIGQFVQKYAPPKISEDEFFGMCRRNGLYGEIIPRKDVNNPNEIDADYYVVKGKYADFCRTGWRKQYLCERDSLFSKGREYLKALLPDIVRAYNSNMSRWVAGSIPYKIKKERIWNRVIFSEGGMAFPVFDECDPIGHGFSEGGYGKLSSDEMAILMIAVSCHLNNLSPEELDFNMLYWDMKVYSPFCIHEHAVDVDTLAYKLKSNQKFGLEYGKPTPVNELLYLAEPPKGVFD